MSPQKGIIGKDNTNGSGSTNSNFTGGSTISASEAVVGQITVFENVVSKKPFFITLDESFKRVREGASRTLIEQIRPIAQKTDRDKIKAKLPCILYSGIFSGRNDSNLKTHSGYVILDFDHIPNLSELKKTIFNEPFILACWISPSGDGLKAVARIKYPSKHRLQYKALLKHFEPFEVSPDEKNANEARVCYESYDPDILVKDECEEFDKILSEREKTEYREITVPETNEEVVYKKLKKWIENRGELFVDGNRNTFLMKLASACNRTGIGEISTVAFLSADYIRDSGFSVKELQQVVSKVYKNYSSQHNTAGFEKKEGIEIVNEKTFDATVEVKDLIRYKDVFENQEERIRNGESKGETTHFKILDRHFRWERRATTVMHGYGNHGKSAMLLQLMLLKSMYKGWKWVIFNPENAPADRFYQEISEMYLGEIFDKNNPRLPSAEERFSAMQFVDQHFFYIYPETENPTPDYILKRFMETIIKHNVDGVVIDPFNQLIHDRGRFARDDQYLEGFLNTTTRFAQNHDVVFVIVAHPNKPQKANSENKYDEPTVFDINGGAMWNNKTNNILCFNRPNYYIMPTDTWCTITSQKIKRQQLNGTCGTVNFTYNRETRRYYEIKVQTDTWDLGYNPMEEKIVNADRPDIEIIPSPIVANYYEVDKDIDDDLPF